jgi:hypothetical protein
MWNDIGQRIQSAANLQIRIEAQFAPEPKLSRGIVALGSVGNQEAEVTFR